MSHIQAVIKGQGQKAENEQVETPKDLAIHEVLVRNTAIAGTCYSFPSAMK